MSSAGGWRVEFSKRAARDLRQLDPQVRRRVIEALEGVVSDPPRGYVVRRRRDAVQAPALRLNRPPKTQVVHDSVPVDKPAPHAVAEYKNMVG